MVKNLERRQAARRAFQKLWVAGTLGAFFTAFVRTIPVHFELRAWPPEALYTTDMVVRYGYLSWLLAYFFISNLENEQSTSIPKKWEITYDIVQSSSGLTAALFLGFIVPVSFMPLTAYSITNGAIFLICALSICWFNEGQPCEIIAIRYIGAGLSLLSVILSLVLPYSFGSLVLFLVLLIALWVVLLRFIHLRLDTPGSP